MGVVSIFYKKYFSKKKLHITSGQLYTWFFTIQFLISFHWYSKIFAFETFETRYCIIDYQHFWTQEYKSFSKDDYMSFLLYYEGIQETNSANVNVHLYRFMLQYAQSHIRQCHKGWSHFDPDSSLLTGGSAMQPVNQPSAPTMAEIPLCLFG